LKLIKGGITEDLQRKGVPEIQTSTADYAKKQYADAKDESGMVGYFCHEVF
jgi:hypothetical protein